MKYTNCPTCGGPAEYVSENFMRAGILISRENDQFQKEFEHLNELAETIFRLAEKKVEHMNSRELFLLYRSKLQQEIIAKQIEKDNEAEKIRQMSIDLEAGLNKMLGGF